MHGDDIEHDTFDRQDGSRLMQPRTVLIVTPYFAPYLGGVECYVENLAKVLYERHGWRVVILTMQSDGNRSRTDDVYFGRIYRYAFRVRVSNTPVRLGWTALIRGVVIQESVDLINAHAPVPLLADAAARACPPDIPFVLTYHAGPMRNGGMLYDAAGALYERLLLPATARRADEIICSSAYVAESFAGPFADKVTTISPGVDPAVFSGAGDPAPCSLLFVASLSKSTRYKGLDDLLSALAVVAAAHPSVRLEVVGTGDAVASYVALADALGVADRTIFRGALSGEDLVAAYRRAAVVVLPTHYDSFPTVLVEAMAVGRPVVSTFVGGVPSLVTPGVDGLLVTPGDVPALARAINVLLDSPLEAADMGRRGAEKVRADLTWATQGARTETVFRRALGSHDVAVRTVAVISPFYPPHIGGVEAYAQRLAAAIDSETDLRAVVITTKPRGWRSDISVADGIRIVRLPAWFKVSNTPINPLWVFMLRRALISESVDVVHAHAPVPFLADLAVRASGRRPTILTYHSGPMVKNSWPVDLVLRAYERLVLPGTFRRVNSLVVASPTTLGADRPHAEVITPGVDTSVFMPQEVRGQGSVVLYVGRLDRTSAWKGVDVLIKAFAAVADEDRAATLRLVGWGDAVPDLRALAAQTGVASRVEFVGPLTGTDLVNSYRSARAVVLPSRTAAESFGMVLIEAMACGTPVIGSDIGGIPHVIDVGVDGLIVPPGNIAALATALRRVLQNPDEADAMGRNGRRKATVSYDWKQRTSRHIEIIRGLLANGKP